MIRIAAGLLALLVLLPALAARDKPDTPNPAQRYQALEKEYRKTEQDFDKALKEARTAEGMQKVRQEAMTQLSKFYPRYLALAEQNSKDPVAMDALIWVISRNRSHKYDPQSPRTKALKILLRDHVRDEKMAKVCELQSWVIFSSEEDECRQLLRAVLEKNPHRAAKAQACLALAAQAENRLRLAQQFKERPGLAQRYESIAGKEAVEGLLKADPDKVKKEAEAFYERIVKEFASVADADGNKIGGKAKDRLEALRHPVVVGKAAPEIEGEDIDGTEFKLSDYRGKVVLLDFWGNW